MRDVRGPARGRRVERLPGQFDGGRDGGGVDPLPLGHRGPAGSEGQHHALQFQRVTGLKELGGDPRGDGVASGVREPNGRAAFRVGLGRVRLEPGVSGKECFYVWVFVESYCFIEVSMCNIKLVVCETYKCFYNHNYFLFPKELNIFR